MKKTNSSPNFILPINRILSYLQMADSIPEGFSITISVLSGCYDIPINVVRNDILNLLKYSTYLYVLDDDEDYDFTSKDFQEKLLIGKFDNTELFYDNINDTDYITVPLTEEEAIAYQQYTCENYSPLESNNLFCIKRSAMPITESRLTVLMDIQKIIQNNKCVSFDYSFNHETGQTCFDAPMHIKIRPLKIAYDATDNNYAILTTENGIVTKYYLDWINNVHSIKTDITVQPELLNNWQKVWNFCFNEPPLRVKVKFYNEGNVFEQVFRDLYHRTPDKLNIEDNYLIYEDTVIGKNAFINWIYSFGSSAIVLEPSDIRQHIIDNYRSRLDDL